MMVGIVFPPQGLHFSTIVLLFPPMARGSCHNCAVFSAREEEDIPMQFLLTPLSGGNCHLVRVMDAVSSAPTGNRWRWFNLRNSICLAVIIAISVLMSTEIVQSQSCDTQECRQLFTNCEGVSLKVFVDDDSTSFGVTEDWLFGLVENRLRAAGIYDEDNVYPVLGVTLHTIKKPFRYAFILELELVRALRDPVLDQYVVSVTWQNSIIGLSALPGFQRDFTEFVEEMLLKGPDEELAQSLDEELARLGPLDNFVLAFQRVREETCSWQPN